MEVVDGLGSITYVALTVLPRDYSFIGPGCHIVLDFTQIP